MSIKSFFGNSLTDRLNQAGIALSFANAVKNRDTAQMLSILESIGYSKPSAEATTQTFLHSPNSYKG